MLSSDIIPWAQSHRRRKGDWPTFADFQNTFLNGIFIREPDFRTILRSLDREALSAKSVLG
jgi:hypothetical protein